MMSRWRGVPRNDDAGDTRDQKSIFNFPGRVVGKRSRSTLDGREKRVAEWYILNNCEEVAQYLNYFSNSVRSGNPSMAESEVDQFTNSEFPKWLRSYFIENPSDPNEVAWSLSYGAAISVTRCKKYIINGYRFSTVEANAGTLCCNYGVCCRGDKVDGVETDYYGKLVDILQLSYPWDKVVTLFKCEWFDNSPRGTKMDKHGNIEIHWTRRYTVGYDPFILAQQAEQVYYTLYPTSRQGWRGVIKTKARHIIPNTKESETNDGIPEPFQADVEHVLPLNIADDDVPSNLFNSAAELELIPIQIDDEESDDEEEMIYSDSESEFDDYETPEEGMQADDEEQESSD